MVVVIGGGIAGLAAARTLRARGVTAVVLEARDRLGGRVWTDRSLGVPIDLGASWIHGSHGNPIAELADDAGVVTTASDHMRTLYIDDRGDRIDDGNTSLRAAFHELLARGGELAHTLDRDVSVAESIALLSPGDELATAVRWGLSWLELVMAGPADALSARHWDQEVELPGPDRWFPRGYDGIVTALAAGIDARLDTVVTGVAWRDDGVRVELASGDALDADAAIVTVPLAVLAAGDIDFDPPLPPAKLEAAGRLGTGVLDKVALAFDQPFWPPGLTHLAHVGPRGRMPGFTVAGNVLLGWCAADHARQLEELSDREATELAIDVLCAMFGSAVPAPRGSRVSRWHRDRFARGSYSHIPVGATGDDYDAMAAPAGRLRFAGEATHRRHPSTVHGAYLSGVREAEALAAELA